MFIWVEKRWNSTTDQKWDDNYLYNGQLRTSCRTTIVIFQQQLCFYIEINGSVKFFRWIVNIVRSSNDSKCQASMWETDADRSWQAFHGKPWTSIQKCFQTIRTRKIQRKAFLFGCSPSQLIWRTWRCMCPHIPLKERTQIRKVRLQKWRHNNGSTAFILTSPKDRNCDVCLRSKIARVPCRRGDNGSIPWAEKFGDLITAEHKIVNEGSESRNNHRFAVVVQDLATQWIQSYLCETKTSQETGNNLRKFLDRRRSPKLFIRTIH